MQLVSSVDLQLFFCAPGKNYIFSNRVGGCKGHRWLYPQRLSKAHHRVVETFLDLFVATGLKKQVLVDLVSIFIPWLEGEVLVHFFEQALFDATILVHVNMLHQVVDTDLCCSHSS